MEIKTGRLSSMVEICTDLCRKGFTFTAEERDGIWIITLTGGF